MKPPCDQCTAVCCRQYSHDYAAEIGPDEEDSFPEAIWWQDSNPGLLAALNDHNPVLRVLPYVDGKCVNLGEDNRCKRYDTRPEVCQSFSCVSSYKARPSGEHGYFCDDHPEVVQLIELKLKEIP